MLCPAPATTSCCDPHPPSCLLSAALSGRVIQVLLSALSHNQHEDIFQCLSCQTDALSLKHRLLLPKECKISVELLGPRKQGISLHMLVQSMTPQQKNFLSSSHHKNILQCLPCQTDASFVKNKLSVAEKCKISGELSVLCRQGLFSHECFCSQ